MKQQKKTVIKPNETPICRQFIYRLRIIYRELATGKKTARYLAELLEVSTKTIYRDLDYCRDMLGLEMESSNTGRTMIDGIHNCPICGGACEEEKPKTNEVNRIMERFA